MQHTQNTDLLNPALDPRELVPALARASGGAHRRRITHPAYPTHLLRPHDAPPTVGAAGGGPGSGGPRRGPVVLGPGQGQGGPERRLVPATDPPPHRHGPDGGCRPAVAHTHAAAVAGHGPVHGCMHIHGVGTAVVGWSRAAEVAAGPGGDPGEGRGCASGGGRGDADRRAGPGVRVERAVAAV